MNEGFDNPVAVALRQPSALSALSLTEWDLLIRQARRAGLLGRLARNLEDKGCLQQIDRRPRGHLISESTLARKHGRDVRWEVQCIARALEEIGVRTILLKGAAYLMADLPAASGRLFSDVDILVPKDDIDRVEEILEQHGFDMVKTDSYNQRYYRRWMHQIPPMQHIIRRTVVDVHHTLVPETARVALKSERLRADAVALPDHPGLFVLAPPDMVLHSAVHLFNEGEFDHGLRDLSDMDLLLRHFAEGDPAFWTKLTARAHELDLERPLHYALRYAAEILATPVPAGTVAEASAGRISGHLGGGRPREWLMDALFRRALRPDHASCDDRFSGLARWLLYVRAHHLRMPPHLLVPHLVRKAVMRHLKE